jgi:hypothetical protein
MTTILFLTMLKQLTVEDVKRATIDELRAVDEEGNTVLFHACYCCPIEVVKAILDRDIDPNVLSKVRLSSFIIYELGN